MGAAPVSGIHFNRLENGRSVGKVPDSLKHLVGASTTDQSVVVLFVAVLETKLERLVADHFGEHIAECVRILCQDSGRIVSLRRTVANALSARQRQTLNLDARDGEINLGIGSDAIVSRSA